MVLADRPTTSRWTPPTGRTLLLGQADPRRQEPRPTLRQQDTLAGVNRFLSQTSVQPSTLRAPSHARAAKIQHRDRFLFGRPGSRHDRIGDAITQPSGGERPACHKRNRRLAGLADDRLGRRGKRPRRRSSVLAIAAASDVSGIARCRLTRVAPRVLGGAVRRCRRSFRFRRVSRGVARRGSVDRRRG